MLYQFRLISLWLISAGLVAGLFEVSGRWHRVGAACVLVGSMVLIGTIALSIQWQLEAHRTYRLAMLKRRARS